MVRLRIKGPRRRRPRSKFRLALVLGALALTSARARAQPAEVHAGDVELDPRTHELLLKGDVRVDDPPFHLSSDALRVRRDTRGALDVDGDGRLTFCPCLGAPLAVRFQGALVAPPGDLILRSPALELFGLPVLWLPYFWLRSPGRFGLLPPEVAYRGADGVFLGGGFHVPWTKGDESRGLEVRAGGYVRGGAAVDGVLVTPASTTHVGWDHLHGDGLKIDARGALEAGASTFAWDADAIRGARGVAATTGLDAASRPYDRAQGETSVRAGGWTFATGLWTVSPRGGDWLSIGMAGPYATLRRAEAIAGAGAYDATVQGGMLAQPGKNVSFGRGEVGALLADRWGPVGASLAVRGAGDVFADGEDVGDSRRGADGAASARARLGLPFGRGFESGDPGDPWIHRLEPSVGGALMTVRGDRLLGVAPGRGIAAVRGDAWMVDARLVSEQGRWGKRIGSAVLVAGGVLGGGAGDGLSGAARAVARGRLSITAGALATTADAAATTAAGTDGAGGVFVGRARLGEEQGLHLLALAAGREGIDPVLARTLTDAPLEPSGGFLSARGWTLGGRARVPLFLGLATSGGADVDATDKTLVAARGALEWRDHCGCLKVTATGSHRIGRDGVDVWLAIDVAPR